MFFVLYSLNCTHILARLKLYWLSKKLAPVNPESSMGDGIGQWLLNCTKNHSLTVFHWVILQKLTISIYDHLAWRLIGLYKGHQEETVYRSVDIGNAKDHAELKVVEKRSLQPSDSYRLLLLDDVKTIAPVHLYPFIS